MKRVLVTGDQGYIGSTVSPLLIKKGYQVVGLDTSYFKSSLAKPLVKYRKIKKDIRKVEKADLQGIDYVIHLAGLSNDPLGEIDPNLTDAINYKASIRLAELAKKSKVKRFIFSSSCSIYGIAKNGIVNENSKTNPVTAYAKSKIKTENELKRIKSENFCIGLPRNSTVYGYSPKFRSDLVVNDLTLSSIVNKQIKVLSDGTPWRPLIDVRDLSAIFIEFLRIDADRINGEVINVGFAKNNFQIKDIAKIIKKYLNYDINYSLEHGKDARSYKVDFSKFAKTFPEVHQKWTLEKSVKNLSSELLRDAKQKNFERDNFVRLAVLQKLINDGKLNKKLYWLDKQ